MARLVRPTSKFEKLRMRNDLNDGELLIVDHGKNPFLWIGHDNSAGGFFNFSGPKTLEKFARSLLKAFGKGDV